MSIVALVDNASTAAAIEATVSQGGSLPVRSAAGLAARGLRLLGAAAAPASQLQTVVIDNGLPEPVSTASKLGQAIKWFRHSPEPRLVVVSLHGVTSDSNSFVVVPVRAKRHPSALVSVHELLMWLDDLVGPTRVHLDCCFGTLHQAADDTAAMTAFRALNGAVVTGYSYAAEANSSALLVPHAIAATAEDEECPAVNFQIDF